MERHRKDYSKGIEEFIVNNIFVHPTHRQGMAQLLGSSPCRGHQPYRLHQPAQDASRVPTCPLRSAWTCAIDDTDFYVCRRWLRDSLRIRGRRAATSLRCSIPRRPTTRCSRLTRAHGIRGGSAGRGRGRQPKLTSSSCSRTTGRPSRRRGRFNPATGIPDRPEDWSVIELNGSTNYNTINAFYVTSPAP